MGTATEHPVVLAMRGSHADGAIPNGQRVRKLAIGTDETDGHAGGSLATVLGSVGPVALAGRPAVFCYLLEWDDLPGVPVFTADSTTDGRPRIEAVEKGGQPS